MGTENEKTSDRIIEASLAVFSELGFHEATVRQIAERAGIAPATVYEHFPSKERVLQALFDRRTKEATEMVREHLEGIECTFDRIRKHTWFMLWYFERNPDFAAATYLALPFHALLKYGPAHDTAREQERIFMGIMKQGQAVGDVRDDLDADRLRDLYFGGLQRVITMWLLSGRNYSLVAKAKAISEFIVRSVRTDGPQAGNPREKTGRERQA